ncbi:hypothetical protein VYU27_007670 [Nannochloropsis oceanica]
MEEEEEGEEYGAESAFARARHAYMLMGGGGGGGGGGGREGGGEGGSFREDELVVAFEGETGHGTGPTQEFYSLVCREVTRKGLGVWRGDEVGAVKEEAEGGGVGGREGGRKRGQGGDRKKRRKREKETGDFSWKEEGKEQGQGGRKEGKEEEEKEGEEPLYIPVGVGGLFPRVLPPSPPSHPLPPLPSKQAQRNSNRSKNCKAPAPTSSFLSSSFSTTIILSTFRFLGRLIGKAFQENRLLSLPLSLPLCKLLVGHPLILADVGLVDPQLGRCLAEIESMVVRADAEEEAEEENEKEKMEEEWKDEGLLLSTPTGSTSSSFSSVRSIITTTTATTKKKKQPHLQEQQQPQPPHQPRQQQQQHRHRLSEYLEALSLDFTLPGYPWYELREGGKEETVDSTNVRVYLNLVTRHFLIESIQPSLKALKEGLLDVLRPPLTRSLALFSPIELRALLCAEGGEEEEEEWTEERIGNSLVCKHGYHRSAPQIQWLVRVLASLEREERKKFLMFVCGTPRLPIGGFAALRPLLTVVRKEVPSTGGRGEKREGGALAADLYLPSCSTCQVYLKLPAYSSEEVLREKLKQAMTLGQEHFALD